MTRNILTLAGLSVLALACSASIAIADDIFFFSYNDSVVGVSEGSMVRDGESATTWVSMVAKHSTATPGGRAAYTMIKTQFDCSIDRYKSLNLYAYDRHGKLVYKTKPDPVWVDIAPDSFAKKALNVACNHSPLPEGRLLKGHSFAEFASEFLAAAK